MTKLKLRCRRFISAVSFFDDSLGHKDVGKHHVKQIRNVDVFRGQAPSQDVVAISHHLDGKPANVGMKMASVEEQPLPWFERNAIEQTGDSDSGVAWIIGSQTDEEFCLRPP